MNKTLKFILKLTVSLGFLIWIILRTDWNRVLFYAQEIHFWKIVVYVILILSGVVVSSYKWKLLAGFKNIHHSFGDFFRFYLAGAFINNFMPSFIGGDTFRAYQIGKGEKKYVEAASTVMADRITGFVGSTILVVFFSLLNLKAVLKSNALILINLLVLASLFFDLAVAKAKQFPLWKKVSGFFPEKILHLAKELDHYNDNSKILSKTILWSMIFGIVGVAIPNLILFWALGIKIGILNYLSVIFLISIVSSIPISINNIGIKEWAYVTFFGVFGADAAAVMTVAILSRFIQMVVSFFALPTYLKNK